MENKSINDLTTLFDKSYKCFEMFNGIIRTITISRVIMNMYEDKTTKSDDIYPNRFDAYSDSLISTITLLKDLTDKYGNIGKIYKEFQDEFGYVILAELMAGEDYENPNSKYDEINCTYEVALNKFINKAIILSSYVDKINGDSISIDEKKEFQRLFYFLVFNGKKIMRKSSEKLADVIYLNMQESFKSKEKVCI
jgi:hypothetical protein